jgi:uncharacterized protein
MARDYDRSEAFPPLGARSDTGTLFGPTMVLVAVTVALFTLGAYLARDLSSGWAAGDATRRDLSRLARGRWWALVALIAFGVVLVFVSIPGGSVVYAVLGLTRRAGHGRLPARPNQTAARP